MKKNLPNIFTQEKQKQAKKNITTLIDEQGNTLQKNTDILNECKNFYQKLYTNHKTCSDMQKQLLQQIKPKITELQNQNLTKQIQITEIQQALQTMENGKSPGIDGIPIEFYKEFFELLKKDLQDIFNNVLFEQKTTPKTWNQAIISLIPKQTEKLNSLKYWRPISLLCTDYKILTKILANRLKQILPKIISQEQNCSIPQRTIFNNLFLIRDLIKYQKEKKNKFYLLQIDQEKAFDKIDRPFLFQTMEKLGFSIEYIKFIEILYKNNTSVMTNNGFLSEAVKMLRGLRQGCPLSLPLYVIQGEITTKNINKDKTIIGLQIPNYKKQLKISQDADDSIFFLQNQESVKNVLIYFQKLKQATGATINLEKTTVLPINTNITMNLPTEITIKEQNETTKILGIYFNEDLQYANNINWQKTIDKMEKHINKLSPRILSLNGKVILANTLILSKTSFLSNIFPLDIKTTSNIQNKIFQYIWKNKQEPIARKTIFLSKKLGGLNLLEPQAHNIAMRIKHLLQLKQKEKTPPWMNIATYWVAIDLFNFSQDYLFLMNNNRTKTINNNKPYYYKDIIYYIKNENKEIKKIENPNTKNIYQKIIQEGSKQHKISGENLWKKLLPKLDFKQIWKNTYNSYAQPFCTDLHYRLLHYSTKTNEYMHKCTQEINPKCNHCQKTETNLHLFTECHRIDKVWTYYQTYLTKLTGQKNSPQQHILTLSANKQSKHTTKLILTIVQIIIYEIWTSRNNLKYDKTVIPQDTIINKRNAQLRNIIRTHYKYHKLNETLNIFQELFCIKQVVAKLDNNLLVMQLK